MIMIKKFLIETALKTSK